MKFLSRFTETTDWELCIDGTTYKIHNLPEREFERFVAETIELQISPGDMWPYLKRWINEDEGEWIEANGQRYPEHHA